MKIKKDQRGQAIVEMTVSLIGMAAIFCGFILIARLTTGSIESVLSARENVDIVANNHEGTFTVDTGNPIRYWKEKIIIDNKGHITRYPYRYRRDDEAEIGANEDSNNFKQQLSVNKPTVTFSIDSSSYVDRDSESESSFKNLEDMAMFLNAADLKSGRGSNSITFDSDMTSTLLLDDPNNRSITVDDTLYMPFTDSQSP